MKTELHAFCCDFSETLEPLGAALNETLEIVDAHDESGFKKAGVQLREVDHQLAALRKKIDRQQSYLLIFGPLKSGKSTLMNAISGSYVSEVSSLPAYPAMVYVNHGTKKKFAAVNYNGTIHEYKDEMEMAEYVRRAHQLLAERLLEVEQRGEDFDPAQHMADSIRRIDVELPASNLRDSGMALVDTPGLYSRMKFGYDLMTREFRDTASCAIFVVKSDNLFFDKVFEEFNQLLGCFNRIFLVANIDSNKKDLNPDGTLTPALESRSPEEIIRAFESLSMSAPLRQAFEDGRLNVYTIDLLRAAQEHLRAAQGSLAAEQPEEADGDEGERDETDSDPRAKSGFDAFIHDLTQYLNSSGYLRDFIDDSLRNGRNLSTQLAETVRVSLLEGVKQQANRLRPRVDEIEARMEALGELDHLDWSGCFDHLFTEKERLVNESSRKYAQQLSEKLGMHVDDWRHSSASWNELLRNLNSEIESAVASDLQSHVQQLKEAVSGPYGGAQLDPSVGEKLQRTGLSLEKVSGGLLEAFDDAKSPDFKRIDVTIDSLPVKRLFFWDIVCFRNESQVRRKLLGSQGDEEIPAVVKQKRFTEEGVARLRSSVTRFPEKELPGVIKKQLEHLLNDYVAEFVKTIARQIQELQTLAQQRKEEADRALEENHRLAERLEGVTATCEKFNVEAKSLGERFPIEEPEPSVDDSAIEEDDSDFDSMMSSFDVAEEDSTGEEGARHPG